MIPRIGFGFDVHRLEPDKDLWLGGVLIPSDLGAVGHSDADTLIHAICDALFGAAGLRDIGHHFPDSSNEYKGIDSKLLLGKTVEMVRDTGYEIGNIDATICLQAPKIAQWIGTMIITLAEVMQIAPGQLNIKATTTEKLGFEGRREGISCYAIALIHTI